MRKIYHKQKSLTHLVLERIAEVGAGTLKAFLPNHYPEARLMRELFGLNRKRRISRKTFSTILSRLRSDGLVERSGNTCAAQWHITKKGMRVLKQRQSYVQHMQKDGIARLVVFDIPETERKKRRAIRLELVYADFKQLQKSVWIGYRPLPESFLVLLDALYLKKKVHIFSIREKGTLFDIKS